MMINHVRLTEIKDKSRHTLVLLCQTEKWFQSTTSPSCIRHLYLHECQCIDQCFPFKNNDDNYNNKNYPVAVVHFFLRGVVQHFTPKQTTVKRKEKLEPNLGPSAAFLFSYNKGGRPSG